MPPDLPHPGSASRHLPPFRGAHLELLSALPHTPVLVLGIVKSLDRGNGLYVQPRKLEVPGEEAAREERRGAVLSDLLTEKKLWERRGAVSALIPVNRRSQEKKLHRE